MVGESNQNVFLIQIDASSFAEFEISEFEISRFDCIDTFIIRLYLRTVMFIQTPWYLSMSTPLGCLPCYTHRVIGHFVMATTRPSKTGFTGIVQ